ncbi:MAG: hypothetical protein P1V20_31275, partial [Verrucomicrobiales bacterium]|nr:hypothetical protein [Verrucomicrobiales bacterium]
VGRGIELALFLCPHSSAHFDHVALIKLSSPWNSYHSRKDGNWGRQIIESEPRIIKQGFRCGCLSPVSPVSCVMVFVSRTLLSAFC